jgi:ABC-2 type transport system permease protein
MNDLLESENRKKNNGNNHFSTQRFMAIVVKEFIQMRRDRLTFAMMIVIPLVQLALFGYAINTNPKALPTAIVDADNSIFTRSIVQSLKNSSYFDVSQPPVNEKTAKQFLQQGKVQFVLTIPVNFSRQLLRGEKPNLLIEADATDPAATSNAVTALASLNQIALSHDLNNGLQYLQAEQNTAPFEVILHRNYNPEIITQYNIVPGLMGVILTMTMIMMTGLAIARERERGTLENLLATPVNPLEVMLGKIIPYILVGYFQVFIVLLAASFLFHVPMEGSIILLLCSVFVFVTANLAVGILFSTIAKNQMQAMQMTYFFFLPSLLLSGFMFPFRGMPSWAQALGEILPLTHFLRIVRGILLKGNGILDVLPQILAMLLFMIVVILLGLKRYRRTLD